MASAVAVRRGAASTVARLSSDRRSALSIASTIRVLPGTARKWAQYRGLDRGAASNVIFLALMLEK